MNRTVVKKIRLTEKEAKELARVAMAEGISESEFVRESIRLRKQFIAREAGIAQLIEWSKIKGPDKERYRFK